MVGNRSQLGRLFRDARKAAGLTQAELASRASIGLSAVQAIERGRGRMSSLTGILKTLDLELRGRQLSAGPIGPALVLARKRRKISGRKLSKALRVSRNTLVAVEAGGGLVGTLEAYAGAVAAGLYGQFLCDINPTNQLIGHLFQQHGPVCRDTATEFLSSSTESAATGSAWCEWFAKCLSGLEFEYQHIRGPSFLLSLPVSFKTLPLKPRTTVNRTPSCGARSVRWYQVRPALAPIFLA